MHCPGNYSKGTAWGVNFFKKLKIIAVPRNRIPPQIILVDYQRMMIHQIVPGF
jgi:hypothetical protein